jgi:hypothetical protein
LTEPRDQIEPNLYVSRWLREREYDPGGEGVGIVGCWLVEGRRRRGRERTTTSEVCAGCGCCCCRLLPCRAVGRWGIGAGEGIGAEEVDPSVNVRWAEEWECVSKGGREEKEGNGNRARTTMNRTELWRQSINQTDGIRGQRSPGSGPLSAIVRIRDSPRKPQATDTRADWTSMHDLQDILRI